jgi:6-phosphogluconolactonase (cycloisomerase 2 family)
MRIRSGSVTQGARRARIAAIALAVALPLGAVTAGAHGMHRAFSWHFFHGEDRGGVVYVMTNNSSSNRILVYSRDARGQLRPVPQATAATGGRGGSDNAPIDPLGSQGALHYDAATQMLFAVNAGDNTVTAFDTGVQGVALRRRALVPSGGFIPVSVAVSENRLYVLNAGGTGSVATFEIAGNGSLRLLGKLDLGLSASATSIPFAQVPAPNQVIVDALGRHLVITHAGAQELLTATLDDDGIPAGPLVSTITPGAAPFALQVTRFGTTLVAEAASGSVSAFDPPSDNMPMKVTAAAVGTGQAATCWIVAGDNGFAYTSNTGSGTVSQFAYSRTGKLELVDAVAGVAGGAPIDLTLAGGGNFLYTLDAASGQISGFAVNGDDGKLRAVETQDGLPASAGLQGIAARDL